MEKFKNSYSLDYWGIGVSGFCLVHCLGFAALTYLMPSFLHLISENFWVHLFLFILVGFVALVAFYKGYALHKKKGPGLFMSFALVLLFLGLMSETRKNHFLTEQTPSVQMRELEDLKREDHSHHSSSHWFTILGSLFMVGSHLYNHRELKCRCCPHHEH